MAAAKAEGGRVVKRWVATCEYTAGLEGKTPLVASISRRSCPFNDRKTPQTHLTSKSAVREAREHAIEAGHVGAREVSVRRTYTPRTIASEEIVGG